MNVGNVENWRFEDEIAPASLDLILCLDVLEHLVDPWSVVRRLSPLLAPGGRLIVSVPNIRMRIPMKPAIDSETKPATCSDFIPASIPI